MFPFELLSPEASPANLLEQVRWRDGLYCPRCRSESVIKHSSYPHHQRYLCNDCGRTFKHKADTILAHAKIGLNRLLFAFYTLLRFNTSIRQLDLNSTFRIGRFGGASRPPTPNASAINLVGSVEIDEVYVIAGLNGRERNS